MRNIHFLKYKGKVGFFGKLRVFNWYFYYLFNKYFYFITCY